MRYRKRSSVRVYGGRAAKPRRLTPAQIEANRKAFDAAPYVVEGRHRKGDLVVDLQGHVYRIVTRGIRYHEDVSSALYGARKGRAPKEFQATFRLRRAIDQVLREGTQEPGSRGLRSGDAGSPLPEDRGEPVVEWRDGRPGSLASFPRLTVYESGVVRAVRPIYDDTPVMAWMRAAALAARLTDAAKIAPQPYHLPEARNVRARSQS